MVKIEFISKGKFDEICEKERKEDIELIKFCEEREIDGKPYLIYKDVTANTEYAVPEARKVIMGAASNGPGKIDEFVEIVEREGACKACWWQVGKSAHEILGKRLSQQMPQYKWEIDGYYVYAEKR